MILVYLPAPSPTTILVRYPHRALRSRSSSVVPVPRPVPIFTAARLLSDSELLAALVTSLGSLSGVSYEIYDIKFVDLVKRENEREFHEMWGEFHEDDEICYLVKHGTNYIARSHNIYHSIL